MSGTYYPKGTRPAMRIPGNPAHARDGWELERIGETTATLRHPHIVGGLSYPVQDIEPADPTPWMFHPDDYPEGHSLRGKRFTTSAPPVVFYAPPRWMPRTAADLAPVIAAEEAANARQNEHEAAYSDVRDAIDDLRTASVSYMADLIPDGIHALLFAISDGTPPRLRLDAIRRNDGHELDPESLDVWSPGLFDLIDEIAADLFVTEWDEADHFLLSDGEERFIITREDNMDPEGADQ